MHKRCMPPRTRCGRCHSVLLLALSLFMLMLVLVMLPLLLFLGMAPP